MSDQVRPTQAAAAASLSRRGQTLVEFALVLPMLLVLFLAIADFARVFSASIAVEAAARNAAEVAAEEYLRLPPEPFPNPAPTPGDPVYYGDLHDLASRTACAELRRLPNAGYDAATDTCHGIVALVCVHDSADPSCSSTPGGVAAAGSMPNCDQMSPPPTSVQEAETTSIRYVEVRVCYRFTTIFALSELQLPLGFGMSLGELHLQRSRTFTVADW